MLLANATFLCIGLTAGALLSLPRRRAISEIRLSLRDINTELLATDKRIAALRGYAELAAGRHEGMCRRIGSAEQAHEALAANMLQLGAELNGRLDALQAGPAGPDKVTADFTEVSRRINSLENRSDERLSLLERRVSELSNQDALVATIDRQLQDMQAFIVEAAERARQQVTPLVGIGTSAARPDHVPPLRSAASVTPQTQAPMAPGAAPAAATSAAELERLLAMQRDAQQAFALRRQGQTQSGIQGAGL